MRASSAYPQAGSGPSTSNRRFWCPRARTRLGQHRAGVPRLCGVPGPGPAVLTRHRRATLWNTASNASGAATVDRHLGIRDPAAGARHHRSSIRTDTASSAQRSARDRSRTGLGSARPALGSNIAGCGGRQSRSPQTAAQFVKGIERCGRHQRGGSWHPFAPFRARRRSSRNGFAHGDAPALAARRRRTSRAGDWQHHP